MVECPLGTRGAGGNQVPFQGTVVDNERGLDVRQLLQDKGFAQWRLACVHAIVLVAKQAQQGKGDAADGNMRSDAAGRSVIDGTRRRWMLEDAEALFDPPPCSVVPVDG